MARILMFLTAAMDRKLWRVVIIQVLQVYGTQESEKKTTDIYWVYLKVSKHQKRRSSCEYRIHNLQHFFPVSNFCVSLKSFIKPIAKRDMFSPSVVKVYRSLIVVISRLSTNRLRLNPLDAVTINDLKVTSSFLFILNQTKYPALPAHHVYRHPCLEMAPFVSASMHHSLVYLFYSMSFASI